MSREWYGKIPNIIPTAHQPGAARLGAGRQHWGPLAATTPATPSVNKAAGASPGDKRIQQSLGQKLGARTSPAMKRPAVLKADVISWEAEVNEEMKLQKQVKEGPVRYPFGDPDAEYILLQAGTAFTEHTVWFDSRRVQRRVHVRCLMVAWPGPYISAPLPKRFGRTSGDVCGAKVVLNMYVSKESSQL